MPGQSFDNFIAQVQDWINLSALPGAQCLLIEPGEAGQVIRAENLGYQDIEQGIEVSDHSLYRLASATKIFVSVGFLRLVQKGRLSLKDPVSTVLPEYGHLKLLDQNGEVTDATQPMLMEDLLRHSCGYGYGDTSSPGFRDALMQAGLLGIDDLGYDHWCTNLSLRDWAKALAELPLEDEPGTRVKYGLGHDIAGAVMEKVTGQSLEAVMMEEVFNPLDLTDSFFIVPRNRQEDLTAIYSYTKGASSESALTLIESARGSDFLSRPSSFSGGGGWDMLGNGGMVSSASDFANLLQVIVNLGEHNGRTYLETELANRLLSSQSHHLSHNEMLPGCEYSYGVAEVRDPADYEAKGTGSTGPIGKMWWGGSTNTYFFYVPDSKRIGVMLSNLLPFSLKGAVFKFGRLSA